MTRSYKRRQNCSRVNCERVDFEITTCYRTIDRENQKENAIISISFDKRKNLCNYIG